jgi:WD40 repeat protein
MTKPIADELVAGLTAPHLRAITALPDLPHPALSRVLTGHIGGVSVLAVAPDGSWLASADADGEIRTWDPTTGTAHDILTGHTLRVAALAVAPDGSWLASVDAGGEVRIWHPATGTIRHTLTGHTSTVTALTVAPDGSWLASADTSGEIRDLGPGHWRPTHITTRRRQLVQPRGVFDNHSRRRIWCLLPRVLPWDSTQIGVMTWSGILRRSPPLWIARKSP